MRIRFLILAVTAAIAAGVAFYFAGSTPTEPEESPAAPPPAAPPVGGQARPPVPSPTPPETASGMTPEQQAAEDARLDEQELRDAIDLLHDADAVKRAEGADQLSAHPTPEAEAELAQALRGDTDASVREAAAASLAFFDKPSKETWDVLLATVEDTSPEVQSAAATSLETLITGFEDDPGEVAWVRRAIKKIAKSPKLTEDTRESLRSLIEQWEEPDAAP